LTPWVKVVAKIFFFACFLFKKIVAQRFCVFPDIVHLRGKTARLFKGFLDISTQNVHGGALLLQERRQLIVICLQPSQAAFESLQPIVDRLHGLDHVVALRHDDIGR
jgi:hypothetical protein